MTETETRPDTEAASVRRNAANDPTTDYTESHPDPGTGTYADDTSLRDIRGTCAREGCNNPRGPGQLELCEECLDDKLWF